jgi:Zn finger protein HypA/HybF involved in hydrogenase expression
MTSTIQDYCSKYNYEIVNNLPAEELINSRNRKTYALKLTCGHTKEGLVSALNIRKPCICITCKNINRNGHLSEDKTTIKCKDCHNEYPATRKYYYNWACRECKKKAPRPEDYFMDKMKTHVRLNKNYVFPDLKRYYDFYISYDDKIILIEIDDVSHTYNCNGRISHLEKDFLVLKNNVKLIRFHKDYMDSFIESHESILNMVKEDDSKLIHLFHGNTPEEVADSERFYKKVYQTSALYDTIFPNAE